MNRTMSGLVAAAICIISVGVLAIAVGVKDEPVRITNSAEMSGYPAPGLNWDQGTRVQAIRAAGLHGDRSQIPAILAHLQKPAHPDFIPTGLHALARLGATEALPTIDSLRQQRPGWGGDFATVARARLIAEANAREVQDTQGQAARKVDSFYHELRLSPSDLSAGVARYRPERPKTTDSHTLPPLEVYAMRELADMVYVGPYTDYANLPGVANVDFSRDYGSLLKVRMAPMSQDQRLAWLINDLAHKTVLSGAEDFELQLAADGGKAASHLAMAKLREMDSHREGYTLTGFDALFEILYAGRDNDQAPLFVHFAHDRDPEIADMVRNGHPLYQFVEGY